MVRGQKWVNEKLGKVTRSAFYTAACITKDLQTMSQGPSDPLGF